MAHAYTIAHMQHKISVVVAAAAVFVVVVVVLVVVVVFVCCNWYLQCQPSR